MRLRHLVTAAPVLRPWRDGIITVMAFAGWYAGFSSRASVIAMACAQTPSVCDPSTINALDRWALVRHYDWLSDHLSYWTQDASAVLAIASFFLFSPLRRRAWTQIVMLLQSTFLNGALLEVVRLMVQRPRPFVYLDPLKQGAAPAHYTSFYSGHTSFAALACTCAVLSSLDSTRTARRRVMTLAIILTVSTGILRVTGSRHFITDVVMGALVGVVIAIAVNSLHRDFDHAESHAPAS